jgi:3-oxoacid CoA-transferase A subunit
VGGFLYRKLDPNSIELFPGFPGERSFHTENTRSPAMWAGFFTIGEKMKNKLFGSFREAVADIPHGSVIMLHSFSGPGGIAQNLIKALKEQGAGGLVLIGCNLGQISGVGMLEYQEKSPEEISGLQQRLNAPGLYSLILGESYITPAILIENGQVIKAITTWAGPSVVGIESPLEKAVKNGEIELEIVPQGTLAERIRAGGAGLGGFFSPVGVGTVYQEGRETRNIQGRDYILEIPLKADIGFVRANKADLLGNLIFRGSSRSFNPLIATAATITIAEVDEIVEPGELDPESVVTPGVFVDRMVKIGPGDRT